MCTYICTYISIPHLYRHISFARSFVHLYSLGYLKRRYVAYDIINIKITYIYVRTHERTKQMNDFLFNKQSTQSILQWRTRKENHTNKKKVHCPVSGRKNNDTISLVNCKWNEKLPDSPSFTQENQFSNFNFTLFRSRFNEFFALTFQISIFFHSLFSILFLFFFLQSVLCLIYDFDYIENRTEACLVCSSPTAWLLFSISLLPMPFSYRYFTLFYVCKQVFFISVSLVCHRVCFVIHRECFIPGEYNVAVMSDQRFQRIFFNKTINSFDLIQYLHQNSFKI